MVIFLASHFRLAQINYIVEIWKDKNFERKNYLRGCIRTLKLRFKLRFT